MLEVDLLNALVGIYTAVSQTPNVSVPEDSMGVTMMNINILYTDNGQDIPIAHKETIVYFVLDRGKDTEQAFLSDQISSSTVDEIRTAATVIKDGGTSIKIH